METKNSILELRTQKGMSQDELAEKVYVSRQTISNWENDKSYPDVNSLILLSEVFHTSIDNLIKGDVEVMKEQVKNEDRKEFEKISRIFSVLFLAMMITPIPLIHYLKYAGIAIWALLAVVTLYFSFIVEKKKKQFDIQTYREIIAFMEGEKLDEIAKAREEGKTPYQKILLSVGAAVVTLVLAIIFTMLLR